MNRPARRKTALHEPQMHRCDMIMRRAVGAGIHLNAQSGGETEGPIRNPA
jgi:hypothetical protein